MCCSLGLLLLVLLLVWPVHAATCKLEGTCAVCSDSSYASNHVSGLPRLSFRMQLVSNDISSYDVIRYINGSSSFVNQSSLSSFASSSDPQSIHSYGQGVLMLAIVLIFVGVISVGIGVGILCARYLYCYCVCCCEGGSCGKRYPTAKSHKWGLGFVAVESEDILEVRNFRYPKLEVRLSYIFLFVFVFFVLFFISMVEFRGNRMFPEAAKAISKSPIGAVELIRAVTVPLANLTESTMGDSVSTFLRRTDELIAQELNYTVLLASISCFRESPNNLPSLGFLEQWVKDAAATRDEIEADVLAIPTAMEDSNEKFQLAFLQVSHDFDLFARNLSIAADYVNQTLTIMGEAQLTRESLVNASNKIILDLETLTRTGSNNRVGLPSEQLTQATEQSLLDVQSVSPPTRLDINQSLFWMELYAANLSTLPDFNSTAAEVVALETLVAEATSTQQQERVKGSIANTSTSLDRVARAAFRLNDSMHDLHEAGNALASLNGARDLALSANDSLFSIDFDVLSDEVAKFGTITAILPCLSDVTTQIGNLDRNVFAISRAMRALASIGTAVDVAVASVLQTEAAVQMQIRSFQRRRNSVNIGAKIDEMVVYADAMDGQRDVLSNDSTWNTIAQLKHDIDLLNNTVVQTIDRQNAQLAQFNVSSSFIPALDAFEAAKTDLLADLNVTSTDFQKLWTRRYCSLDVTSGCFADGLKCGTCLEPINSENRRCSGNLTIPCSSDTVCTSYLPERCTVDDTRVSLLRAKIIGLEALVSTSEVNDTIADLQSLTASAEEKSAVSSFSSSLFSLQKNLSSIDADKLSDDLDNWNETSNAHNLDQQVKEFLQLRSATVGIGFEGLQYSLQEMASSLERMNDSVQRDLDPFESFILALEFMHVDHLPNKFFPRVNLDNLRLVRAVNGSAGMMLEVAESLDDLINTFSEKQTMFSISSNLTDSSRFRRHLVESMESNKLIRYGALHYILRLADMVGLSRAPIVDPHKQSTDRVWVNGSGDAYSVNRGGSEPAMCASQKCINREIDYWESRPVSDFVPGSPYIGLTRKRAFALPFVFPSLCLLLAVLSAIPNFKLSKYFACCNAICVLAFVPFVFPLSGIAFMVPVVFGDACYALGSVADGIAENLGRTENGSSAACAYFYDGVGNLTSCNITVAQTNYSNVSATATVHVNLVAVLDAIVGNECYEDNDPVFQALNSSREGMRDYTSLLSASFVETSFVEMRPKLLAISRNMTNQFGVEVGNFMLDIGAFIGCGGMRPAFQDIKSALCCDVATSFYWMCGGWVLLAFTLLLCGVPSSLMIRKRNAELWGPEYEEANMALERGMEDLEKLDEIDESEEKKPKDVNKGDGSQGGENAADELAVNDLPSIDGLVAEQQENETEDGDQCSVRLHVLEPDASGDSDDALEMTEIRLHHTVEEEGGGGEESECIEEIEEVGENDEKLDECADTPLRVETFANDTGAECEESNTIVAEAESAESNTDNTGAESVESSTNNMEAELSYGGNDQLGCGNGSESRNACGET